MSAPSDRSQEPLMTVRAAVILMLGTQIAVAAGVLTVLAGNAWAVAVLAAGGAFSRHGRLRTVRNRLSWPWANRTPRASPVTAKYAGRRGGR